MMKSLSLKTNLNILLFENWTLWTFQGHQNKTQTARAPIFFRSFLARGREPKYCHINCTFINYVFRINFIMIHITYTDLRTPSDTGTYPLDTIQTL